MIKKVTKKFGSTRTMSEKSGFALLFSVLIASLLLTIGLSIFSIALKEFAISTASRQSIHAFYAADSGREYALYRDTKRGDISTFNPLLKDAQTVTDIIPESLVDTLNPDGPNYYVTITKTWADGFFTQINTTVTSYGHDVKSGDRVERAIRQNY
jgi:DNA-binding beta-propeller fold protein YncE